MLAGQRQAKILEVIEQSGAAKISELKTLLGVSDMTVRRDIESLAKEGRVQRVHGGVVALGPRDHLAEPGFQAKSRRMVKAKQAIACAARQLVRPGTSIAISAGTTTCELARHLGGISPLTIITNSVPAADVLFEHGRAGLTVALTGGERTLSHALVGPLAERALEGLHVAQLFLGVHGLDAKAGLTTPNLAEAATNRAFIGAAQEVIVLADHTKWGVVGLLTMAFLSEIDVLVTDELSVPERELLAEANVKVMCVGSGSATADVPT